ncbi:bifunctional nuclease family protein, partial [Micrococcus endophyticus]
MTEPRPEDVPEAGDVPMSVLGVRVELPEQHHVILLVDPPGRIMVPLWVGAPEAAAAAL